MGGDDCAAEQDLRPPPTSPLQQDLAESNATVSTEDAAPSNLADAREQLQQAHQAPRSFLRTRSAYSQVDETGAGLSISLDFLHQPEDDTIESARRGRSGPLPGRPYKLADSHSHGFGLDDSPDFESPVGSEAGWRRGLATNSDPVHKSGLRSNSRDPPGSDRLATANGRGAKSHHPFSSLSPHFDSSSPSSLSSLGGRVDSSVDGPPSLLSSTSLGRSASASRAHQKQQSHFPSWVGDSGNPVRHLSEPKGDGSVLSHSKGDWANASTVNFSESPRDTQRPPIVQRPVTGTTSSSTAMSGGHLSNSPTHGRPPLSSPPLGLATMPEEAGDAHDVGHFLQSTGSSGARSGARHRSTSSAAALQYATDSIAPHRGNSADSFSRSISLWRGEFGSTGGMSPGTYANAARQQQQQQQNRSSPTQYSHSSQLDRGRFLGSAFDDLLDEGALQEPAGGGSESRRHSIAADHSSVGGAPMGQRRAIGFEVSRPHAATSRTSSVGRHQAATPRAGYGGSGLFGGGGLAISEDDLAADVLNLHVNLDDVVQRQQQDERRRVHMRIPSSNAAASGVHAASMPPGYGTQGLADFGLSPPIGSRQGKWPVSARFLDDEGGTTWSDMAASPSANSAFTDYGQGYPSQSSEGAYAEERKTMGLSATAKAFHGANGPASAAYPMAGTSPHHPSLFPPSTFTAPYSSRQTSQERGAEFVPASPTAQFQPFAQQQLPSETASSALRSGSNTLSELAIASLVTLGPLAPASGGPNEGPSSLQELGKGVPLQMLPRNTRLYIVEFKEGRTDLYFRQPQGPVRGNEDIRKADLVIVEADRGKDLGTVVNDTITVDQVQSFLTHQAELAQINAGGGSATNTPHPAAVPLSRLTRSINPKRLFAKAGPADTSLLQSKTQDEERALTLCTTKVNQRGLPMTVVAAELQWDRRKLTFYYTATQRVDFRDLVKELFRLYKTRIWMCHLSHPSGTGISS